METILGLILQVLILGCQIAVCVLGYVLVTRGAVQQKQTPARQEEREPAPSEEERRMQEQMQKMMDGMNNILGYDGHPQGDKQ